MNELQRYIEEEINSEDGMFKLTSNPDHWAAYGIYTIDQLNRYLDIETYVNLHKDVYGFKPVFNLNEMTDEEIQSQIEYLDSVNEIEEYDDAIFFENNPEDFVMDKYEAMAFQAGYEL